MSGYNGYSMSNNAVSAYENGEKPISKWTKVDMLAAVKSINPEIATHAQKLTAPELKSMLLKKTSWHHTSSKFNETSFYSVSESAAEELTAEKITRVIECREPKAEPGKIVLITAEVTFDVWTKNRFGRVIGKREQKEIVKYRSDEKIVKTSEGMKRLSSLNIIKTI